MGRVELSQLVLVQLNLDELELSSTHLNLCEMSGFIKLLNKLG